MVLVRGEVSSWAEGPEHRWNQRVGGQAVFSGVSGSVRVWPTGRDISVDSLATQLIINRCLAHGVTP